MLESASTDAQSPSFTLSFSLLFTLAPDIKQLWDVVEQLRIFWTNIHPCDGHPGFFLGKQVGLCFGQLIMAFRCFTFATMIASIVSSTFSVLLLLFYSYFANCLFPKSLLMIFIFMMALATTLLSSSIICCSPRLHSHQVFPFVQCLGMLSFL